MKDPKQIITTDKKTGRVRVQTLNDDPSMTQQQFADECDINHIMKRYEKTGEIVHRNSKQGVYADFSEIKNYHEMMDQVLYAQEAFLTLPAKIRARFRNDPGQLLSFLDDSKNLKEAEELGLLEIVKPEAQLNAKNQKREEIQPPVTTPIVTPPAS